MKKKKNDFTYYVIEEKPKGKPKPRRRLSSQTVAVAVGLSALVATGVAFVLVRGASSGTRSIGRLSNAEQAVLVGSARHSVPLGWLDVAPNSSVVRWSPGGSKLAVGQRGFDVSLYSLENPESPPLVLREPVETLAFSPDGRLLAGAKLSGGGGLIVWETDTGNVHARLDDANAYFRTIAFRPDGRLMAVAWENRWIFVWDMQTPPQIIGLTDAPDWVNAGAISPDGRRLAAGGSDSNLWSWDAQTGLALHKWFSLSSEPTITALAFHPDSRVLASGHNYNFANTWDVETQQSLFSMYGHAGPITALAFSPNGELLATASEDGTVRLWQWNTQTRAVYVDVLQGHRIPVEDVAFSPDGMRLAFVVHGIPEEKVVEQASVWLWDVRGVYNQQ